MYQNQSFSQQIEESQLDFQDEDYADFVLNELKRSAREYATAALEAANPQIRQTFQNLLQRTLEDQATVFQEIQKLGGYQIQQASQEQILEELQKQSQKASKLQSFVQQQTSVNNASTERSTVAQARSMQQSYAANSQLSQRIGQEAEQSYTYVPEQNMTEDSSSSMLHTSGASVMHQNQNQNQHQNQPYQQQSQNRMQAMGQAQIQPMLSTSQYPNATHQSSLQQGFSQGQSQTHANTQAHTNTTSYTQPTSYGSTTGSFGREQNGYAAAPQGSSDAQMGRGPSARIVSRTQPGMQAQGRTDNQYTTRQQPGGRYSF
ncbi:spore coat protein [Paenibacillus whitsoniae]|uniref:Spore coat protein n=1 Tax=Paenibacillus whitsoniae TaxID=2496558 RepID=A0A430J678_9BACL|nr:spore coat protein [Paenibacillus whitsoniae]RTE03988.1 spore coat protein [Paenibacillus whitsoniae]